MEASICRRAVEAVISSTEELISQDITLNSLAFTPLLSYTSSNDKIMKDPLKYKELAMCILSKLAYNTDKIDNVIKNWGLKYKVVILETLVYVIVYSKAYIFISFKGTSNFNEVISDIDFVQIDDSYNIPGKMHRGFHNLILKNNVIESIEETLKSIITNKSVPIIITGHSLGAALATIFYAYLSNKKDTDNVELITFGSPRVGDSVFSKQLVSTRLVHGNDIITKLPIFKYKHTENLIRLGSSYSCRVFTDHMLEGYYKELMKNTSFI